MIYIRTLYELKKTDLPLAGGKGANLGELMQAGLPVPGGFVVTTDGYRAFVASNRLAPVIQDILKSSQKDDPASLDAASERIQECFLSGQIPHHLQDEIVSAYAGGDAVAVRSSATAEDLPDLSFAGQQDTYLNILGEVPLLDAVKRCWASLWTARAIGYRARNDIAHEDVSLAVVIQQMVQSESSGVLFTANPLTGKRGETVIDATLGLGEALVSGQVEPDHYVLDSSDGNAIRKVLGAKALSITGKTHGGTKSRVESAADRQALPDEQIYQLAGLGWKAEIHFGCPQDMEWAWAGGKLYVVQSRPVTSLYPLPDTLDPQTLEMLLSFGVWQGMLDPYTPLGQDAFKYLVVGFARKFGATTSAMEQRTMLTAGDRLFVNLTYLLRSTLGRNVADLFLSSIDPATAVIVRELLKDARFSRIDPVTLRDRIDFLRVLLPLAFNVINNLMAPARGRDRIERKINDLLESIQHRCTEVQNLSDLVIVFEELTGTMPTIMMPVLVGGIAAGQAPYQILLRKLNIPGSQDLLSDLTRGLPYNVTTQMDLQLWDTACQIKKDGQAVEYFLNTDTDVLVGEFHRGTLPPVAQAAVAGFLTQYGMRGVAEIDLGRPRWKENPTNLFQALKSYLKLDPSSAPDEQFRKGAEKAEEARKKILGEVRKRPGGFVLSCIVGGMIRRFRELGGLRETPKFFVVRLLSIYREAILAEGKKQGDGGIFERAEDILFLHLWELKAMGEGETRDWKSLVSERRNTYERELRRKRVPRILLSDGTAYYDAPARGDAVDANTLTGSPVSAGVVEGPVRVVFDPHGVQMQPGDILVCPATDPAWTPLFLAAGGLITEVGGMMTHGSVVAREYGIPAVVGVSRATERLKTGQRVRLDGSGGVVQILE